MKQVNETYIITRAEVCKILNLSDVRVDQLVHMGILSRVSQGKYDLAECVRNYVAYIKAGSPENADLDDEKLRKLTAEANLKELELQEKIGELVQVDEVAKVWGQVIQIIRQAILSMPTKLAPEIILINELNEAKAFLDRAVNQVLVELSVSEFPKSIN